MQRYVIVVLCGIALGVSVQHASRAPVAQGLARGPVAQHLGRAIATMDHATRSPDYRESIEYLRAHEAEAVDLVTDALHRERGSFRKWQVAYVIGRFGGAHAIETLRAWVGQPLPPPERGAEGSHEVDLSYVEEFAARAQAVSSIAAIAAHRPALRDLAVSSLMEIAETRPPFRDAAFFELRGLLRDDFESLRAHFGPEDQRYFDPYMPPPEWHGLLQKRLARHDLERRARAEKREPVCQAQ